MAALDISPTSTISRFEVFASRYSDANLSLPAFFFIRSLKRCRATTSLVTFGVFIRDFAADVFMDLPAEAVSQRMDVLFAAMAELFIFEMILRFLMSASLLLHTCPRGCDD